jgi:hypothetical protein
MRRILDDYSSDAELQHGPFYIDARSRLLSLDRQKQQLCPPNEQGQEST